MVEAATSTRTTSATENVYTECRRRELEQATRRSLTTAAAALAVAVALTVATTATRSRTERKNAVSETV